MLSVRLEDAIENQLNFVAQQKHLPKSKIIKEALLHYFEMLKRESKQKTPYELGRELFGKFESGKGDLSMTYKQKLSDKLHAKNAH